MIKNEVLQDLDGGDLTLPPYWIMTRLPPRAPPGLEAALMPDPGPGEVPAAAAARPPALPEFVEPPFGQAPFPVTSLWPTLPGSGSNQTTQAIPASPSEY